MSFSRTEESMVDYPGLSLFESFDYFVCYAEKSAEGAVALLDFSEGLVYFPLYGKEYFPHFTCNSYEGYSRASSFSIVMPLSIVNRNHLIKPLLKLSEVVPGKYVSPLFEDFMSWLSLNNGAPEYNLITPYFLLWLFDGAEPLFNYDAIEITLRAWLIAGFSSLDKKRFLLEYGLPILDAYWTDKFTTLPEEQRMFLIQAATQRISMD